MPTSIVPFAAERTAIDGLWLLTMKQITDERGTVREFYRQSAFVDAGLPDLGPWLQLNVTETGQGAVRGMHGELMHKLCGVVSGAAFGAWVDLRTGSPTLGVVVTAELVPGTQVLVPPGVGNGFQAVAPGVTQYLYCFDVEWVPGMAGVACSPLDPALAIPWPVPIEPTDAGQISAKDASAPAAPSVPRH